MNTPNDEGPAITQEAFNKVIRERDEARAEARTSLRDRFAGKAMQAILGKQPPLYIQDDEADKAKGRKILRLVAIGSYEMADAMLAARDGKEGA